MQVTRSPCPAWVWQTDLKDARVHLECHLVQVDSCHRQRGCNVLDWHCILHRHGCCVTHRWRGSCVLHHWRWCCNHWMRRHGVTGRWHWSDVLHHCSWCCKHCRRWRGVDKRGCWNDVLVTKHVRHAPQGLERRIPRQTLTPHSISLSLDRCTSPQDLAQQIQLAYNVGVGTASSPLALERRIPDWSVIPTV